MSYMVHQSAPAAATLTTLYTVPALKETVCSTLSICNRSSVATEIRVAVRKAGAAIADEHYVYYDLTIPGNETFKDTSGMTLATTDVVSVYATLATISFNLSMTENDL
jgi:hypothetical protein